jgi:hypothetical protein
LTQNENPPETIGLAEEILNRYGDRGLGCTGLVIGKFGNFSSEFFCICDLITKFLANQHFNYYSISPHYAQGMFKREINHRWGLTAARACARLLTDRFHILVFGFDDKTELGAQARQRQF